MVADLMYTYTKLYNTYNDNVYKHIAISHIIYHDGTMDIIGALVEDAFNVQRLDAGAVG